MFRLADWIILFRNTNLWTGSLQVQWAYNEPARQNFYNPRTKATTNLSISKLRVHHKPVAKIPTKAIISIHFASLSLCFLLFLQVLHVDKILQIEAKAAKAAGKWKWSRDVSQNLSISRIEPVCFLFFLETWDNLRHLATPRMEEGWELASRHLSWPLHTIRSYGSTMPCGSIWHQALRWWYGQYMEVQSRMSKNNSWCSCFQHGFTVSRSFYLQVPCLRHWAAMCIHHWLNSLNPHRRSLYLNVASVHINVLLLFASQLGHKCPRLIKIVDVASGRHFDFCVYHQKGLAKDLQARRVVVDSCKDI